MEYYYTTREELTGQTLIYIANLVFYTFNGVDIKLTNIQFIHIFHHIDTIITIGCFDYFKTITHPKIFCFTPFHISNAALWVGVFECDLATVAL